MNKLLGPGIISLAIVNLAFQLGVGYYLVRRIDSQFNAAFAAIAVGLELLAFLVLTMFAREFYHRQGINFTRRKATALVILGQGFSRLVPFGDYIAQRYYFSKRRLNEGAVFDYVITLYSFAILWLVGLFLASQIYVTIFYPSEVSDTFIGKFVYFPIAFTALLITIYLLRNNAKLEKLIQKFFKSTFKRPVSSPFSIVAKHSKGQKRDLIMLLPLLATWIIEGLVYTLCIYAFGINPPIILVLYVYFFVKLFRFVPIFPAGVGQIEAVSVLLFAAYGYPPLEVATGSIMFRLVSYWLPILLASISYRWLFYGGQTRSDREEVALTELGR